MTRLDWFCPGHPATAGSKAVIRSPHAKATGLPGVVIEAGSAASREQKRAWRTDLRAAAAAAIERQGGEWPTTWACRVCFTFLRRRPGTHFGSKKGVPYLKATAPRYPTQRPDLLKVARAAEDALTGIVWADDSQIVHEELDKVWGEVEGLHVTVEVLYGTAPQPTP